MMSYCFWKELLGKGNSSLRYLFNALASKPRRVGWSILDCGAARLPQKKNILAQNSHKCVGTWRTNFSKKSYVFIAKRFDNRIRTFCEHGYIIYRSLSAARLKALSHRFNPAIKAAYKKFRTISQTMNLLHKSIVTYYVLYQKLKNLGPFFVKNLKGRPNEHSENNFYNKTGIRNTSRSFLLKKSLPSADTDEPTGYLELLRSFVLAKAD